MTFDALRSLARLWKDTVGGPRRRATVALLALVAVVGLLVARAGTPAARIGGALAVAVFALGAAAWSRHEERVLGDPARAIKRLAWRVEPARAARALRALSLVDSRDATSEELARLHLERALRALPSDRIADHARRIAFALGIVALCTAALTFGIVVFEPWAVVEGADVLVARHGVAPVGMEWLEEVDVTARPPDYLHLEEKRRRPYVGTALPYGTLITVRGIPTHHGRRLALTDGASEVPFVDDGAGQVVARWPLTDTVELRVAARFGDVVVPEPLATPVRSIRDESPSVVLEGAPKQLLLALQADAGDIPIRYEATDDHGLREVHLVLRAGAREERRVLARLDGETRHDRGGHLMRASDPFLKKSHVPVEVRVEARDNDPLTGPKWGASEAITIVPPDVGEPESKRIEALRKLRDALVDSLAWRMAHSDMPHETGPLRAFIADEAKGVDENGELLDATLTTAYAGVRVSGRLQAMLRGNMRKVREAMSAEAHAASASTHAALVKASERMVLVVDAALHGLGIADAKNASRALAEVADDLALGAAQMTRPSDKTRGEARADAAEHVLQGGAASMLRMGALGRDLGEITTADLSRVARARDEDDYRHAELAARDLAARLREPDPSFDARGHGARAGGESGGGRGTPGEDDGEGSDAERAFDEAARDVERLAQDHAAGVGRTEQSLSSGASEEDAKQLSEEAKKHARAVRDAASGMPTLGAGPDSWTNKGAASREHAEQMARALEQGNVADAVSSGKSALLALDEAKRAAQREQWMGYGDVGDADKRLDETKKRLAPEVRWAEEQLDKLRKKAAERAAGQLSQEGDEEEKIARRAEQVRKRGQEQGTLPQSAIEALDGAEESAHQAARALKAGEADRGLAAQHEAQRRLEQAKDALGSKEQEREGEGEEPSLEHADIPKADQHKGPEEFRRRVIKGLGQAAGGRQRDAVRRYAEGLLR